MEEAFEKELEKLEDEYLTEQDKEMLRRLLRERESDDNETY